jgi:hypothetical protein
LCVCVCVCVCVCLLRLELCHLFNLQSLSLTYRLQVCWKKQASIPRPCWLGLVLAMGPWWALEVPKWSVSTTATSYYPCPSPLWLTIHLSLSVSSSCASHQPCQNVSCEMRSLALETSSMSSFLLVGSTQTQHILFTCMFQQHRFYVQRRYSLSLQI